MRRLSGIVKGLLILLIFLSNTASAKLQGHPVLAALTVRGDEIAAIMPLVSDSEIWLSEDDIPLIPGISLDESSQQLITPLGRGVLPRFHGRF